MKDEKMKAKKPIFKKWWFWVLIVVIFASIFVNMSGDTQQVNSSDEFVTKVETAIQDSINTDEEAIVDVVLKNRDLCVTVDLSKANPQPLTIEDLAVSRTGSITDNILELADYDNQWDTITIDFGDIGKIINSKADIVESDFGRYFPSSNFILE